MVRVSSSIKESNSRNNCSFPHRQIVIRADFPRQHRIGIHEGIQALLNHAHGPIRHARNVDVWQSCGSLFSSNAHCAILSARSPIRSSSEEIFMPVVTNLRSRAVGC